MHTSSKSSSDLDASTTAASAADRWYLELRLNVAAPILATVRPHAAGLDQIRCVARMAPMSLRRA